MRTYAIARALATHGELDLLYVRFEASEPDMAFESIPGITLHEITPSRTLRRLSAYMGARLRGVPDGFARGISRELGLDASRLAAHPGRRRVIADGPIAAAALSGLAARRPVIYNAHNFESGFRGELGGSGSERALRSFEQGLLARSSESWMVSEADVASALELCPSARVRYVPNAVDAEAITPCITPAGERSVIFIANFNYGPNRSGLTFLLNEVFPRVWAELPDIRLRLVGSGLQQTEGGDPRVERLGFVDELATVYHQAHCAVVPLLQGGGTPLKFIEALAYGLPIVATSRAAAGLEVRHEEHCLIADGAEAFAEALMRVLRNGAPELGQRARALALERYSIRALSDQLAS